MRDTTRVEHVAVDWGGAGPVPFGDARRITLTAGTGRRGNSFVLLLPRDRRDAIDIGTDRAGDTRRFRVADFDPEVTTSAAAQVDAFVRAVAAELAGELLG